MACITSIRCLFIVCKVISDTAEFVDGNDTDVATVLPTNRSSDNGEKKSCDRLGEGGLIVLRT